MTEETITGDEFAKRLGVDRSKLTYEERTEYKPNRKMRRAMAKASRRATSASRKLQR